MEEEKEELEDSAQTIGLVSTNQLLSHPVLVTRVLGPDGLAFTVTDRDPDRDPS